MKRLLALDQASKVSGWAYFEDGELKEYGLITAKGSDLGKRLNYIREEIKKLIEKYNINEVYFEDIQFKKDKKEVLDCDVINNVKTFKILAEVLGVVHDLVTELGIPHTAVLASVWKGALGIKGRIREEQKANAKAWVKKTYNIECTQDEADAICIGSHISKKKVVKNFDWSD